jgi:outer membrane protein assembly factor BamB
VGDGAVIALNPSGSEVVAYEVTSGAERWRANPVARVQPQLISGTTLIGLWEGEVAAFSTSDGTILWSATQPFGSPFMNSVGSDNDLVFVAINSLPWGD